MNETQNPSWKPGISVPDVDRVLAEFRESSAYRFLHNLGRDLQWTRPMLELAAECMQRACEIDEFDLMFYIKLLAENHWVPAEGGHAIEQELRAFFMFAAFELDAPHATGCLTLLGPEQRWVTLALEREARNRGQVVYPPKLAPLPNN